MQPGFLFAQREQILKHDLKRKSEKAVIQDYAERCLSTDIIL